MKKLLAIIASAAMTLGAFADDEPATTFAYTNSFESADEKGVSEGLVLDLGEESIWGTTAEDPEVGFATITPYNEATPPTASAGTNYLKLDTGSDSIFRKFNEDGKPVEAGKVFVDTYVKFTVSDGAPSIPDDAQFAMWLQTDGEDGSPTNLMVRCSYIDGDFEQYPTNVALDVDIDANAWHHVVVKTIFDDASGYGLCYFIVSIDDTIVGAANDFKTIDPGVADQFLYPEADYYSYNDAGKIFLSTVIYDTSSGTISSVGFIGNGAIDLVSVTESAEEPGPEPETGVTFTLNEPNGTSIDQVEGATDNQDGTYTAKEGADVTITLKADSGKLFSDGKDTTTVTIEAADGELTIDLGKLTVEDAAAKIGAVLYLTLAEAVEDAEAEATVTLLADVTLDNYTLTKKITLDLAGFDLTGGTSTGQHKIFTLLNGADLTVNGTNSTITGNFYLGVNNGVNAANLTLNGGTYQQAEGVQEAVLQTNGGDTGAKLITATGCSFTSEDIAVYLAGPADTVLTDCDIVAGLTGIEIRAGGLEVVGTTIKATYTPTEAEANGNGSASKGAGIAVVQHTTKQAISVTVGEGTEIDAYTAFYEANPQKNAAADLKKINIALNAGTYKYTGQATNYASVRIEDADVIGAVIPGTSTAMFQTDASDYCAEGYETVLDESDNYYKVAAKAVAKIDNVNYATLKDAVAAVGENDTIELLADCTSVGIRVESGKNFTIDFAGKTVTFNKPGAGSKNTQTQAFQLLQGSTIVFKNGTICCSAENKDMTWGSKDTEKGIAMIIQNYANLTLEGMTIDGANIAKNGSTAARYLVSNNSGDVVFENTIITANDGDFAFDTCKYKTSKNDYPAPTVEVKGTSAITGDIELAGGSLALTAGTLNGKLVATKIGEGVITKSNAFEADAPEGYKWDNNGKLVAIEFYDITFKVEGQADYVTNVVEGTEVATVKPADPVVEGKTFTAWAPALEGVVESNATYTAQFEAVMVELTLNYDTEAIKSVTVNEGAAQGTYAYGTELTIVGTANDGYENVQYVIGTETNTTCTFIITADTTVEIIADKQATDFDPTTTKPEDIPAGTKVSDIFLAVPTAFAEVDAAKFATWCQGNALLDDGNVGEAGKDAKLDAYLLNCGNTAAAIAEAQKQFKVTKIEQVDGVWVITPKTGDAYKNGEVTVKSYEDVECKKEKDEGNFFKLWLGLPTK